MSPCKLAILELSHALQTCHFRREKLISCGSVRAAELVQAATQLFVQQACQLSCIPPPRQPWCVVHSKLQAPVYYLYALCLQQFLSPVPVWELKHIRKLSHLCAISYKLHTVTQRALKRKHGLDLVIASWLCDEDEAFSSLEVSARAYLQWELACVVSVWELKPCPPSRVSPNRCVHALVLYCAWGGRVPSLEVWSAAAHVQRCMLAPPGRLRGPEGDSVCCMGTRSVQGITGALPPSPQGRKAGAPSSAPILTGACKPGWNGMHLMHSGVHLPCRCLDCCIARLRRPHAGTRRAGRNCILHAPRHSHARIVPHMVAPAPRSRAGCAGQP